MKIIAELHTHSEEYCDHASDTIDQFAQVAKDLGYKYYAATNHSPLNDFISPSSFYVDTIGKKFDCITFLAGIEEDLRDMKGGLNLAQCELLRLDFVIVSMHDKFPVDVSDYTPALLAVIKNPAVDCIGHIARDLSFNYDLDTVLKAVKEYGKLIEFNSWSLTGYGKVAECSHVMDRCAELGVDCIVTSDAHGTDRFGDYGNVLNILEEKNFPEELVINASEERTEKFLARRKEEKKAAYKALFTL